MHQQPVTSFFFSNQSDALMSERLFKEEVINDGVTLISYRRPYISLVWSEKSCNTSWIVVGVVVISVILAVGR